MKIVANEYVASQNEWKDVLLLSERVGAAEQAKDSFLFSPWDLDMVDSIGKGITTGHQQRAAIHKKSEAHIMGNTR
ncbi:uncharacterized protein A1O9_02284 [Exophiala aquamarina CBS 119918]|uniref:Uncharacterized protein n=1 Tax=Exophiala aquamarina CBS 119918 TaxID=1182545 RepID=A0A072PN15_9EURO|nr:uncharacterized protein A1O9_02284 [Exophiala aquamarina CBS 119918]KEF60723.1 hypothetical protein A1O9_02284 [Exophiala aquamarina CBS 119918]